MKEALKVLVIFLLCLVTACNDHETGQDNEADFNVRIPQRAENHIHAIDDYSRIAMGFDFGMTVSEMRQSLGPEIRLVVEEILNTHNPEETDLIYTLYFDGLYARIYHATGIDRELLTTLEITSDSIAIPGKLSLGSGVGDVTKLFGEPDEVKDSTFRYFASDFAMAAIEFDFRQERISAVRWRYFLN